jgi:hypothetical protein
VETQICPSIFFLLCCCMVENNKDNLDEIKKLYPQLSNEELRIARDNLDRYIRVMYRIYCRLKAESKELPKD